MHNIRLLKILSDFNLKNLGWSFFGIISAAMILFVSNILVARYLPSYEYGRITFITTFAQFLLLFNVFGMDVSLIRAVKSEQRKMPSISNSLLFASGTSLLLMLGFFTAIKLEFVPAPQIAPALMVLFLSIFLTFRNIADSSLRVSGNYASQAGIKILETGTFLALVLLLPNWLRLDSQWIIGITIFGYLVFFVISTFFIRNKIAKPDILIFIDQFKFGGSLLAANLIGFLAGQTDKLLIGGKIGFTDLGLYNLYYLSSTLVVVNLSSVFINVAFPDFVKFGQSAEFRSKMLHWAREASYVMFFITIVIILITFAFIGKKYPGNLILTIGFSIWAATQFRVSVYHSMISALNKRTFDKYLLINVFVTIIYVTVGIGLFTMNRISILNVLLLNIVMAIVSNMIQNKLIANSDNK